jgi:hypothetical protein
MSKTDIQINVQGTDISIINRHNDDYISLTDMARFKDASKAGLIIGHWLRNHDTIDFISVWEKIHNSDFNITGFGEIKKGRSSFPKETAPQCPLTPADKFTTSSRTFVSASEQETKKLFQNRFLDRTCRD